MGKNGGRSNLIGRLLAYAHRIIDSWIDTIAPAVRTVVDVVPEVIVRARTIEGWLAKETSYYGDIALPPPPHVNEKCTLFDYWEGHHLDYPAKPHWTPYNKEPSRRIYLLECQECETYFTVAVHLGETAVHCPSCQSGACKGMLLGIEDDA